MPPPPSISTRCCSSQALPGAVCCCRGLGGCNPGPRSAGRRSSSRQRTRGAMGLVPAGILRAVARLRCSLLLLLLAIPCEAPAAWTAPGPLRRCLPGAQACFCHHRWHLPSPRLSALARPCRSPALGSAAGACQGRRSLSSRCRQGQGGGFAAVSLQNSSAFSLLPVLVLPLSPPASSLSCSYESSAEILPHTPRLTHFPTVSGSPASLADSMQQKLSCPRRRRQPSPSAM